MKNSYLFKTSIFIFFLPFWFTTYAQKVSNITYRQEQSNIIVSYDLETKTPCTINLFVSTDAGKTWKGPLIKVTGDIGKKIASRSHTIKWNVLEEFNELRGDKIMFKVSADGGSIENIIIGNQKWANNNLNVSSYRNGDIIPEVKDPNEWSKLTTGAWCYFDNDPKNENIYGKLYNWYAVNDPRGLAPKGFHVPSQMEFNKVKNLKNSYELSVIPAGFCQNNGTFNGIGINGNWWSSTSQADTSSAWSHYMYNDNSLEGEYPYDNSSGFSVRCIKD